MRKQHNVLDEYFVTKGEKTEGYDYWWEVHVVIEGEELNVVAGKAWLKNDLDLLILGAWKVRDKSHFENSQKVAEALKALSKWDRTKYIMKIYDLGGPSIYHTETGEEVNIEVYETIMPKLGYTKTEKEISSDDIPF